MKYMSHKYIYSWIITHMHKNICLLVIIYIYYCIVSALNDNEFCL